jgi:hypothetical protein
MPVWGGSGEGDLRRGGGLPYFGLVGWYRRSIDRDGDRDLENDRLRDFG